MRPDRIVVGEVRDGAALDMLQAMNTGMMDLYQLVMLIQLLICLTD